MVSVNQGLMRVFQFPRITICSIKVVLPKYEKKKESKGKKSSDGCGLVEYTAGAEPHDAITGIRYPMLSL